MVEQVIKTIPSKGSRLKMMIWLEFLATFFCLFIFYKMLGAELNTEYVKEALLIFSAWAGFTQWNVGIYAMSETVVKGGEAVMNKG